MFDAKWFAFFVLPKTVRIKVEYRLSYSYVYGKLYSFNLNAELNTFSRQV